MGKKPFSALECLAGQFIELRSGALHFGVVRAHSWFATVVDGNELGPVYSFQLKQLKYEDP